MPWSETTPMTERVSFIADLESNLYTMTELCEQHGISRKTGYKWATRFVAEGVDGLKDRSRAPKGCPHRTDQRVVEALVQARLKHPRWGPRKLVAYLRRRQPTWPWPATSTAGDILKRHGLVAPPRYRFQAQLSSYCAMVYEISFPECARQELAETSRIAPRGRPG